MTLRARLALWLGVATALAIALASTAGYVLIADGLDAGVDDSLREQLGIASAVTRRGELPPRVRAVLVARAAGELVQSISPDGTVTPEGGPRPDEVDLRLARAGRRTDVEIRTTTVLGAPVRVATVGLARGGAIRASADLTGDRLALRDLRRRLIALGVLGALVSAGVGWFMARRLTGPLARLSEAAEHVAATEDLTTPIADDRPDEVGRLSRSLGMMLAALAASRAQQQRLVQDAGHELRTPLTSLRTNLEVLDREGLTPNDRTRLLADLRSEVEELTTLVGEIVAAAATAPGPAAAREEHDLAELAEGVVERHERRTSRRIILAAEPCRAVVVAADIERAISNLVDNALKFSPADQAVDVTVGAGRVVVGDRGGGIGPTESAFVFERFYRSDTARSTPGSGLGLAIVAQVVAAHGGECFAGPRPDGHTGAAVGFKLPTV